MEEDSDFFGMFGVSVVLTHEGLKRQKTIVSAVFRYIQFLKREGGGCTSSDLPRCA